jgi:hypothetical protein
MMRSLKECSYLGSPRTRQQSPSSLHTTAAEAVAVLTVNTPAATMRALGKAVMLISTSIAVSWKRATARIVRNRSCQKLSTVYCETGCADVSRAMAGWRLPSAPETVVPRPALPSASIWPQCSDARRQLEQNCWCGTARCAGSLPRSCTHVEIYGKGVPCGSERGDRIFHASRSTSANRSEGNYPHAGEPPHRSFVGFYAWNSDWTHRPRAVTLAPLANDGADQCVTLPKPARS